jgi:hypothetical protein
MKLPFDLGIKLVLRLLIPGFLLTAGLHPVLATIRDLAGWTISTEYTVVLGTIVLGWSVVSLDQRIYMLYEGRRWPKWLSKPLLDHEQRRLNRVLTRENNEYELAQKQTKPHANLHYQSYLEAWTELRKFPVDGDGNRVALYPTRLGNLIAAYESYPDTRYGIDAIFYWYRLWLLLDKDLREDLDSRQAMADSALYASAVLSLSAVAWLVCAVVLQAASWLPRYLELGRFEHGLTVFRTSLGHHLPGAVPALVISALLVTLARLAYKMSLFPQAQYGETFKSVFDVFQGRIDVSPALHRVARITGYERMKYFDRREQLNIAWYYLQNYRIKCPYDECKDRDSMKPGEIRAHLAERHGRLPG